MTGDSNDDQFLTDNTDDTNPMKDLEENEKLPNDDDTPFSRPAGVQDRIDDIHPSTDTNIDEHERYDAGIEEASNLELPGEAADEDDDIPTSP